jgi:hypothetical protein
VTSDMREAIRKMARDEGLSPSKIGLVLGVSNFSVRYVLDANCERVKSTARVKRFQRFRRSMRTLAQALDAMEA